MASILDEYVYSGDPIPVGNNYGHYLGEKFIIARNVSGKLSFKKSSIVPPTYYSSASLWTPTTQEYVFGGESSAVGIKTCRVGTSFAVAAFVNRTGAISSPVLLNNIPSGLENYGYWLLSPNYNSSLQCTQFGIATSNLTDYLLVFYCGGWVDAVTKTTPNLYIDFYESYYSGFTQSGNFFHKRIELDYAKVKIVDNALDEILVAGELLGRTVITLNSNTGYSLFVDAYLSGRLVSFVSETYLIVESGDTIIRLIGGVQFSYLVKKDDGTLWVYSMSNATTRSTPTQPISNYNFSKHKVELGPYDINADIYSASFS